MGLIHDGDEWRCACPGGNEVLFYSNSLSDQPIWMLARNYYRDENNAQLFRYVAKKPISERESEERKKAGVPVPESVEYDEALETAFSNDETTIENLRAKYRARQMNPHRYGVVQDHSEIVKAADLPARIKCRRCKTLHNLPTLTKATE